MAEDDGVEGDEESQAGTSHVVIPVDGEEDERAPPEEAPFMAVPPEESDVKEDEVPLEADEEVHGVLQIGRAHV